jgi:hypothetical protein
VDVDAEAIGLVVFPVALIDVAISMPELSLAISFIELPFSFIFGAIWPYLGTWTMSHSITEISCIDVTDIINYLYRLHRFQIQAPQ